EMGVQDVEGKSYGRRGWVTHGGNLVAVEVVDRGWVEGVSGKEESVMGSEDVMEGSGGMGGKKVTGDGGGCVVHLGILEGHDEE
ncbi:hypothetical protein KI387_017277, partial [Taxus chinensis]